MYSLDMFKIGIGPSSSHTLGPMKAATAFINQLKSEDKLSQVSRIVIDLYGSLSLTGIGHKTDAAILLGLAGYAPETLTIENIPSFMKNIEQNHTLCLANHAHEISFSLKDDMLFHNSQLPLHENGMRLSAFNLNGQSILSQTWYSTGGGVVVLEDNFDKPATTGLALPYPFENAATLLQLCEDNRLSVAELAMQNELTFLSMAEITAYCRSIWHTMQECMERGMHSGDLLPPPLQLSRRAPRLYAKLQKHGDLNKDPLLVMDWVNMFALAVSEENAAGGRVVTAPTNGACGVVPAVLAYYDKFIEKLDDDSLRRFFLASGSIGQLFRQNASISGAEVGCQGEVGVACSMAAAGLAELMGATPPQVCSAAEIAMEHNLGLTCDPVSGQVQIPCIERNAINAVTAINAARMALDRVNPVLTLDNIIAVMLVTGKDMNAKYRETSLGGLAALERFNNNC